MTPYELIVRHYRDRTAERSGVPLIVHIDEGVRILDHLEASPITVDAFRIHPLLQADEDLVRFWDSHQSWMVIHGGIVALAMEYRNQANAWLSEKVYCKPGESGIYMLDQPSWGPLEEVRLMLIADKVQNYKDFLKYHRTTHPRSESLNVYFLTWLDCLGIDGECFDDLCAVADGRINVGDPDTRWPANLRRPSV